MRSLGNGNLTSWTWLFNERSIVMRLLHQNCQSTAECPILEKQDKVNCKRECSLLKTTAGVFHSSWCASAENYAKTYFCRLLFKKIRNENCEEKNLRKCLQWNTRQICFQWTNFLLQLVFCLFICNCRVFILVWKISKSIYHSREVI